MSPPIVVHNENVSNPYKFHWGGGGSFLRAGNDILLLGTDIGSGWGSNQQPFLLFWNPSTRTVNDRLLPPVPPQPWLPEVPPWWGGRSVGDTDGDGYDDYAVIVPDESYSWLISFLVDGRTRTYRWVQYWALQITGPIRGFCSAPFPDAGQDIDFDGVHDLYFSYTPVSDFSVIKLLAISGRDGSPIWSRRFSKSTAPNGSNTMIVGDLNQDGYHDLIDGSIPIRGTPWQPAYAGHLRAISGLDGQILWDRRLVDYDPFFGPGSTYLEVNIALPEYGPGRFPDQDSDGVPDLAMFASLHPHPGNTYPLQHVVILSGVNGKPLSMEPIEWNMDPYYPGEQISLGTWNNLGDWDGDGWPEFSSPSSSWPSFFKSTAVFGRETLHLPASAAEGDSVKARLWIPAGANKEFHILLSEGFDNYGQSFHAGTWDTHLVDSLLLRASMTAPSLRGTLDAEGRATLQFEVPTTWSLAGRDLYAVAIVHDPTKPDGVLVKSSLAILPVLP